MREAVQHLHAAVPWYTKPKVYRPLEVCTFRQVASPVARGKLVGKSDWEVVQRAFAAYHTKLYPPPLEGDQGLYQPFDMPMAHIEIHDENATIWNTELVVFRKLHSDETRAAFWKRIGRDSEDRASQEAQSSNSVHVECAPGSITVARARPGNCKPVDPNRPMRGSFWSSSSSRSEGLGVARECEHTVLNRYNAVKYEGNSLASPAFGDVYCRPSDAEERSFVKRVLQSPPVAVETMGPPPSPADLGGKPRSLSGEFGDADSSGAADSGYTESVVMVAAERADPQQEETGVKRERGANSGKAGPVVGDKPDMSEEDEKETDQGTSSTEEVVQVGGDDEDDEEEQGAKRARVAEVVDDVAKLEADREKNRVQGELEAHAKAWRADHLGANGQLQPSGREREAELPGDHTTSVDSSGLHIMVDGIESESLARLSETEADEEGRKTVFNSARVVVRLQPTPAYKPPIVTKMVRVEDGAPEGVVVAHTVPLYIIELGIPGVLGGSNQGGPHCDRDHNAAHTA